jgi:NNP family nitrate/nitrite transporter-like MFS transporter
VAYLTLFSLLPEGDVGNRIFFEVLGVASMIVACLCWFFLKEPKGSFAEHHEGEEIPIINQEPIFASETKQF